MKRKPSFWCAMVFVAHCGAGLAAQLPDAPESAYLRALASDAPKSYPHALDTWRNAEDLSAWIAAHFTYDRARALALSETRRGTAARSAIHDPASFFARPHGICVDLARFGVETLRAIDPSARPRYLLLELEPVTIEGNVLRTHWLAMFQRDGSYHFFADSARPDRIAGPYASIEAFLDEYARNRGRPVLAHRELQSYERRLRTMAGSRIISADR